MLDIAVAYNRYKFLGNEFLTWLWFMIETDQNRLRRYDPDLVSLNIGSRLVLENTHKNAKETVTIKGEDANLEEGLLALKKGAVVTEIHLSYKTGAQHWQFSLKGESLNISNLKLPETGPVETPEDLESVVIEKAYLVEKVIGLINNLFSHFVKLRVSNKWRNQTVSQIRKWASS
ncbi:MAG: hypothetical protein IMF00_05830 [Proteobacteria bacterium]|jgi:hypothetical protein|nr:hypothetical protein [Pseudomonadota bacterium]OEU66188.1 MAG: hypothetical protein BA867_05060 [Desulfobacterales bacterium S5133MH16]